MRTSNDPAVVTIRLASGELVEGVSIHGCGGAIARQHGRARIEGIIARATEGKPLGVYEPLPGHVRVYRQTAREDLDDRIVDLRGAQLLAWE